MARRINRITIEGYSRDRHQLAFRYAADDLRFSTSLWYGETDLVDLESHFGRDFMVTDYLIAFASGDFKSLARTIAAMGGVKDGIDLEAFAADLEDTYKPLLSMFGMTPSSLQRRSRSATSQRRASED